MQPHLLIRFIVTACLLSFLARASLAGDLKEHQTDLRIAAGKDREQVVTLTCPQDCTPFNALFVNSRAPALQGGALLLPDLGNAADTSIVTGPLRLELPGFGWSTLTIPMPQFSDGHATASLDTMQTETAARVAAGLDYLKTLGLRNNAVIAHGKSAAIAAAAIAKRPALQDSVNAIINIGFYTAETREKKSEYLGYLEQLPFNVLDIYSDHGMPETVFDARLRAKAAQPAGQLKASPQKLPHSAKTLRLAFRKHGNLRFRQIAFEGTDHRMYERSDDLVKTVRGWLRIYAAGQEIEVQ